MPVKKSNKNNVITENQTEQEERKINNQLFKGQGMVLEMRRKRFELNWGEDST